MEEEKKSKSSTRFRERTIVFTKFMDNQMSEELQVENMHKFMKDLAKECNWVKGQIERAPDTKRLHIQGMAYSKQPIAWKCLGTAHKEKCRAPLESIEYCMKMDTRYIDKFEDIEAHCMEYGERPTWNIKGQKIKNMDVINSKETLIKYVEEDKIPLPKLDDWIQGINQYKILKGTYAKADWTKTRGVWYWGPSGSGKTRKVTADEPDLYRKAQNKWWDGYTGQKAVLLDDFDKYGDKLCHQLKLWTDWYPIDGEVKHGTTALSYERFYITSNYQMEEIFEDPKILEALKRRFTVINIP